MSQFISVLALPMIADGAVVAETFVDPDGSTATAAGNAQGVARNDAADGEGVTVDAIGTAIVKTSAAIVKGAAVQVATGGLAVTLSAGVKVGRALQAAGAAGERIEVLLIAN